MKKVLSVVFVTVLFVSLTAMAIIFFDDTNPNPSGCKTCTYKAIIEN